jgi:putative transposase
MRDRHQKFTDAFDDVFRSSGLEIIRTPFRTPQANGVAERSVRTVRSECLDWLLILNDQHLERILDVFGEHYNGRRPHRALALIPPRPTRPPVARAREWGEVRVQRRDRLGGVVHEYVLAALGYGRSWRPLRRQQADRKLRARGAWAAAIDTRSSFVSRLMPIFIN